MSDYPSDEELEKITNWDSAGDLIGLLAYLRGVVWCADWCLEVSEDKTQFELHTGGWSGNEEIINALQENTMFWALYFQMMKRGGHYYFSTKSLGADLQPIIKENIEEQ